MILYYFLGPLSVSSYSNLIIGVFFQSRVNRETLHFVSAHSEEKGVGERNRSGEDRDSCHCNLDLLHGSNSKQD